MGRRQASGRGTGFIVVCRQRNVAVTRWRRTVLNPILSHRVKFILTVGGWGFKNYKLKKKEKKKENTTWFLFLWRIQRFLTKFHIV